MSHTGCPLFTRDGLAVLDRLQFDPAARASYDLMSGGLRWPDELPRPDTKDWDDIEPGDAYRYLLAYRAAITLGEDRPDYRPVWEQVVQFAANWPGLREERRGPKARRRLLATMRREQLCLSKLEAELDRQGGNNTEQE
jgi:hypothetical protein